MAYNYQDLVKISLSFLCSYLSHHLCDGIKELTSGLTPLRLSFGYIIRSLCSAIKLVTRWTLVLIQLGTLLVIKGLTSYACFLNTDQLLLVYQLYRTYQPILISLSDSGFNNHTKSLLLEALPVMSFYTLATLILCVVRGIKTERSRPSNLPIPSVSETRTLAGTPAAVTTTGVNHLVSNRDNAARNVEDDRFSPPSDRNCEVSTMNAIRLFWYLYPTTSLRGTWLEMKRSAGVTFSDASINGLPLILVTQIFLFLVILSDYIIARMYDQDQAEDDDSLGGHPLYSFYNYVTGLTGLERRPSQIPSDFESVSSIHYGSHLDDQTESLNEVVVEPQ